MRSGDEQVATRRDVLLTRGSYAEPKQPEQDKPCEQADGPVAQRCPGFRLATEPGETFADTAARIGEGLRGEPTGRRPSPAR